MNSIVKDDFHEPTNDKPITWKMITAAIVFASAVVTGAANYWDIHDRHNDARYPQKVEMTVAQSTFESNAQKFKLLETQLASIQVQTAVTVVGAFQQEYDRWVRDQQDTTAWRAERDRLKRQLERAEQYRDCLMQKGNNCEVLRGW